MNLFWPENQTNCAEEALICLDFVFCLLKTKIFNINQLMNEIIHSIGELIVRDQI